MSESSAAQVLIEQRWRQSFTSVITVAVALALTLVLAACGESDATPPAGVDPTPRPVVTPTPDPGDAFDYLTGEDDAVLLIDVTSGDFSPDVSVLELPMIAVYGDGRVITQGPVIAIYPPPALPNLQESRISAEGIQAMLRAAADAGLMDGDVEYRGVDAGDASTTVFTVTANGTTTTVTVDGLELGDLPPGLSQEEIEARQSLRMFRQQAVDYRSLMPPGAILQDEQSYEIERLQLVVVPADEALVPADPAITPGTMEWPLDTPLSSFGEPYALLNSRCGIVVSNDLDILLPDMQQANQLTQWESAEELFAVYPRPLLPHEDGCAERE
jgi:hypothetical protein